MTIQRLTCGRRKFKLKSGGNVENNTTTGQNSKKRDFENIRFRKIVKKSDRKENFKNYENTKISKNSRGNETQENVTKFENKEFDKYILEMKKLREKETRKKYIKSELSRRKQNLVKFFNMQVGIEEVKRTWQFGILILAGIFLFAFYLNFVTFKGELSGEKTLYVKIDGNRGSVLKVNNKYLKNQASIENKKGLEYGFYLMRYKIRKIVNKNGNIKIEGKVLGYKE